MFSVAIINKQHMMDMCSAIKKMRLHLSVLFVCHKLQDYYLYMMKAISSSVKPNANKRVIKHCLKNHDKIDKNVNSMQPAIAAKSTISTVVKQNSSVYHSQL